MKMKVCIKKEKHIYKVGGMCKKIIEGRTDVDDSL
jgi:hypothetical protein